MHSQVLKSQLTKTHFVGLNFSFMCVNPSLLFIYLIPEADTPPADTPRSRYNLGGVIQKLGG